MVTVSLNQTQVALDKGFVLGCLFSAAAVNSCGYILLLLLRGMVLVSGGLRICSVTICSVRLPTLEFTGRQCRIPPLGSSKCSSSVGLQFSKRISFMVSQISGCPRPLLTDSVYIHCFPPTLSKCFPF
jgi:hypothetical protein